MNLVPSSIFWGTACLEILLKRCAWYNKGHYLYNLWPLPGLGFNYMIMRHQLAFMFYACMTGKTSLPVRHSKRETWRLRTADVHTILFLSFVLLHWFASLDCLSVITLTRNAPQKLRPYVLTNSWQWTWCVGHFSTFSVISQGIMHGF